MVDNAVELAMETIDKLPGHGMASMHRDIMNQQPSELESQNGAVVRLGAEVSIPTPTHQFIYHALLPSERIARGELAEFS
jgi:2-dehydropantoate 2-reductase